MRSAVNTPPNRKSFPTFVPRTGRRGLTGSAAIIIAVKVTLPARKPMTSAQWDCIIRAPPSVTAAVTKPVANCARATRPNANRLCNMLYGTFAAAVRNTLSERTRTNGTIRKSP